VSFSPTPGGTGVRKVAAGVETSTASTIVDADVSATAAIAVSKLAGVLPLANGGTNASAGLTTANGVVTSSGTALQQASGVLAGANFISISSGGAPPATSALLRASNGPAGGILSARNFAGTQDLAIINVDASNNIVFGDTTSNGNGASLHGGGNGIGTVDGYHVTLDALNAAGHADITAGGVRGIRVTQSSTAMGLPAIGDSLVSSPYGVHGHVSIAFAGATATRTMTAAEYALSSQVFTGARTAAFTATYPAPASDAAAYYKWVQNSTTGGFNATISTGAGATVALGAGGVPRLLRFDVSVGVTQLI
jgi:hypothetical protein